MRANIITYPLIVASLAAAVLCHSDRDDLLQRTFNGINRALEFVQTNYMQLNTDGVMGSRFVADQLGVMMKRIRPELNQCPSLRSMLEDLDEMLEKAQITTEKATQAVARHEPEYFARIGGMLAAGVFGQDIAGRFLTPTVVTRVPRPPFNESQSDGCLADLIGSYGRPPCNIDDECWRYLTSPGEVKYVITHQVLFLEVAEQIGCGPVAEKLARKTYGKSVQEILNDYCYSVYLEGKSFERSGYPPRWHDLFMEQIALCGVLGFRDFFQPQWLEKILSLQSPSGCYYVRDNTSDDSTYDENTAKRRRKREDVMMDGGCSAHKTAVALGALMANFRFLMDDFLANYRCPTTN